jgi:hypothetical protein
VPSEASVTARGGAEGDGRVWIADATSTPLSSWLTEPANPASPASPAVATGEGRATDGQVAGDHEDTEAAAAWRPAKAGPGRATATSAATAAARAALVALVPGAVAGASPTAAAAAAAMQTDLSGCAGETAPEVADDLAEGAGGACTTRPMSHRPALA